MDTAVIFNIEDFSVDDGPGLRTVVFFKGCSLHCVWCHNPESISFREQIMIYDEKCIGCGNCVKVCPSGAHTQKDGLHIIDETKCVHCWQCVNECYAGALAKVGEKWTVDRLMERIRRNKPYFDSSAGGVTFSGGECMMQPDALVSLLSLCHAEGIHTAVDTAGNVPWTSFEKVLPFTDLFLYDLKAIDPEVHKKCTGSDNRLILENFRRLYESGASIRVRMPYVPGYNDQELPKVAAFLKDFPEVPCELLGYHTLGNSKYKALRQPFITARVPSKQEIASLKEQYQMM